MSSNNRIGTSQILKRINSKKLPSDFFISKSNKAHRKTQPFEPDIHEYSFNKNQNDLFLFTFQKSQRLDHTKTATYNYQLINIYDKLDLMEKTKSEKFFKLPQLKAYPEYQSKQNMSIRIKKRNIASLKKDNHIKPKTITMLRL